MTVLPLRRAMPVVVALPGRRLAVVRTEPCMPCEGTGVMREHVPGPGTRLTRRVPCPACQSCPQASNGVIA